MGDIVNLPEYRNQHPVTRGEFERIINGLVLPDTTRDDDLGTRALNTEEMQELLDEIGSVFSGFPLTGNTLTVFQDHPAIRIYNPDLMITVQVDATPKGLRAFVAVGSIAVTPLKYDPNAPEGRINTEKLAAKLLDLAKKPPFGPPPPAA